MRILLIGINYAPEQIGIAVYTAGFCQYLVEEGHDVEVITAKPYYPEWKIHKNFRRPGYLKTIEHGVKITRVPIYVPSKPTGLKRLIHHFSFAASALIPTVTSAIRRKPALVFTVAPSLISAPVALLASHLSGAVSWIHVQDFELEAAIATGLVKDRKLIITLGRLVESALVRAFKVASTISPAMCEKLLRLGVPENRVFEHRNWAAIDAINVLDAPSNFTKEWEIGSRKVILYSGNLSNKQGIGVLISAASILRDRKDTLFVICGNGSNRTQLEASSAELPNIKWFDLQPAERLEDLLGLATIHVLPQISDAADLLLPSKLPNMFASGRPVVATAKEGTQLAREIEGCGIVTPPDDAKALSDALTTLLDDDSLRMQLGQAARLRAELRWNQRALLDDAHANLELAANGFPNDHLASKPSASRGQKLGSYKSEG